MRNGHLPMCNQFFVHGFETTARSFAPDSRHFSEYSSCIIKRTLDGLPVETLRRFIFGNGNNLIGRKSPVSTGLFED